MSRKLSAREKVLIYILCCTIVLSAAIIFLFLPGLTKYSEASAALDTANENKRIADQALNNRDTLQSQLDLLESDVNTLAGVYYDTMEPEEADVILTGIISRYGYTPVSLQIEPLAASSLGAYTPGNEEEATGEEEAAKPSKTTLNSYAMTINAKGTSNQFAALCGELCLNQSMHLISYDFNVITSEETVNTASGNTNSTADTSNSNSRTNTRVGTSTTEKDTTKEDTTGTTKNSANATTKTVTTYEIMFTVELFTYNNVTAVGSENNSQGVVTIPHRDNAAAAEDAPSNDNADNVGGNTNNDTAASSTNDYILDTSTGYFHVSSCSNVSSIADTNKRIFLSEKMSDMTAAGYKPCSQCIK